MKAWRALPRNHREKLSKKQIQRIEKPDTLFDTLIPEVKGVVKGKMEVSDPNLQPEIQKAQRQPKQMEQRTEHVVEQVPATQQTFQGFVQRRKPKQIMVETKDWETGEIVKQLVDKVRRHKITRLKKTILAARKIKTELGNAEK